MILEIEYHNKVEILRLFKEKYKDKINDNLYSVKWVLNEIYKIDSMQRLDSE